MAVPKAAWLAVEELPVSRVKLDGVRTFGPGLQAGTFAGAAAATATLLPAPAVLAATAEPAEDALAHKPVLASGPAIAGEPLEVEPVLADQPVVADAPVVADEPIVEAEPPGGAEAPAAAEPALVAEPEPSPGPVELAQSQALSQLTQAMLRTLAAQARQGARGSGLGRPAGLSSAMPAPAAQPPVAKGKGPGPEPPVAKGKGPGPEPAVNDSSGPTSSQGAADDASHTAPEAPSRAKAPSAAVARALSLLAGAGEPAGQASREAEVPAGPAEEALTAVAPQGPGEPKNDLRERDPRQDDILPTRKKGLNLRLRLR
jgi:hypothetical protein